MPHKNIYRRYSVDISGQFMEVPGVQDRSRAAKVLRKAVKQVWLIGADRRMYGTVLLLRCCCKLESCGTVLLFYCCKLRSCIVVCAVLF